MKDSIPRLETPLACLAVESGYSHKKRPTHKTSSILGINTANHWIAVFSLTPNALRFVLLSHRLILVWCSSFDLAYFMFYCRIISIQSVDAWCDIRSFTNMDGIFTDKSNEHNYHYFEANYNKKKSWLYFYMMNKVLHVT